MSETLVQINGVVSLILLPMIIVAIFITPFFWEAILFGFFIDALYGYGVKFSTTSLMSVYALGALITVIVAMFFKERLRFNA